MYYKMCAQLEEYLPLEIGKDSSIIVVEHHWDPIQLLRITYLKVTIISGYKF